MSHKNVAPLSDNKTEQMWKPTGRICFCSVSERSRIKSLACQTKYFKISSFKLPYLMLDIERVVVERKYWLTHWQNNVISGIPHQCASQWDSTKWISYPMLCTFLIWSKCVERDKPNRCTWQLWLATRCYKQASFWCDMKCIENDVNLVFKPREAELRQRLRIWSIYLRPKAQALVLWPRPPTTPYFAGVVSKQVPVAQR